MKSPTNHELTALVVDDARAIREALVAMLEAEGVGKVLQAEDGIEALRLLDDGELPVDLVFCDLAMPGVDGVETLRGMATRQMGMGIVLISGLDRKLMSTVGAMAGQMGLNLVGFIYKPFQQSDVRQVLADFRDGAAAYPRMPGFSITPGEIDDALRDDHIEVYYQPKIRLADGQLLGVEALARLQHPAYGIIEPDSFIPVAEQSGLISALTMTVLKKSITQAGQWARAGLDLGIAINMSPLAIRRLDLPERVCDIAEEASIERERITLEITENQVARGTELLHIVSRFRLRGFKLSIDDFGTGQSGLKQLRSLPFTELKIDRAFVKDASRDRDLQSILEASIELGRRLRMDVVAEGVECWPDWHLLRRLGCDMAQGFVAARPIAGAGIPLWAERWIAPRIN